MEEISFYLELVPNDDKEAEQVICSLEDLLNACVKECCKDLRVVDNGLDSIRTLTTLVEPNLGFRLVFQTQQENENKKSKESFFKSVEATESQTSDIRKNRSVITPVNIVGKSNLRIGQGQFHM